MSDTKANIVFQVNTDDLDQKLSKSLKSLGVHYDMYGRLVNKQGQFVAGLSQAAIRMGDYVDEAGKMRNANGQLLDGLTSIQIKLRMWKDEAGNIRSATGETVQAAEQLNALGKNAGKTSGEFFNLQTALDPFDKTLKSLGVDVSGIISEFNSLSASSNQWLKLGSAITDAASRQNLMNDAFAKLKSLGPGDFLAAFVMLYQGLSNVLMECEKAQYKTVDAWDKTAIAMSRVSENASYMTKALAGGLGANSVGIDDQFQQSIKNIQTLQAEISKFKKEQAESLAIGTAGTGAMLASGIGIPAAVLAGVGTGITVATYQKAINEASEKLKNEMDAFASQLSSLVAMDLPKSEKELIQERIAAYDIALEAIKKTDVEKKHLLQGPGEEEYAEIAEQARQFRTTLEARAAAQKKLAEIEAQEAEKERQRAEEAKKVADDVLIYYTQTEEHARTWAEIEQRIVEEGQRTGKTSEEINAALGKLQQEYQEQEEQALRAREEQEAADRERLAATLGVTGILESIKTDEERYQEELNRAQEALNENFITQDQYDRYANQLDEKYHPKDTRTDEEKNKELIAGSGLGEFFREPAMTLEQTLAGLDTLVNGLIGLTAEEREKLRKDVKGQAEEKFQQADISRLGLGPLLEEIKTPYDKFQETMERVEEGVKLGVITQEQANEIRKNQLARLENIDYNVEGIDEDQRIYTDTQKKEDTAGLPKSVSYGSQEAYSLWAGSATDTIRTMAGRIKTGNDIQKQFFEQFMGAKQAVIEQLERMGAPLLMS